MKNIFKLSVLFSLIYSHVNLANNYSEAYNQKVQVKCFVELYGGAMSIAGSAVTLKEINSLKRELVNFRYRVPGMEGVQQVYQVKECVTADKPFKNKIANTLYEEYPR